jgi:hypothetical protein
MRFVFVASSLLVALTGCQINPRAEREIALLRSEILELEDQYYALKSRCEGTASTLGSEGEGFYDGQYWNVQPPSTINPAAPNAAPGRSEMNTFRGFADEQTLEIQDPPETDPIPANETGPRRTPSELRQPPVQDGESGNSDSAFLARLVIHPSSRGVDLDNQPGDEGIELLVQPLDRSGRLHPVSGSMIVRIMESESENTSRQIGLWEFSAEEIDEFWIGSSSPERGILLHLPWNGLPPTQGPLTVLAEYSIAVGPSVSTSSSITVEPAPRAYALDHPLMVRWLEQDSRWEDGTSDSVTTPATDGRASAPQWRPIR